MSAQQSGSGDLTPPSTPSPPSPVTLLIPSAAIVCIIIGVFLIAVVLLLIVRKCLLSRGVECCQYCSSCKCEQSSTDMGCCDGCRELAERLDCSTPDFRVWLDNVCPTKERCSMCCGQLWSCYCCYMAAAACTDVHICPDCSAIECPDCSCGDSLHCALKVPDCTKISCLCIEFERGGNT